VEPRVVVWQLQLIAGRDARHHVTSVPPDARPCTRVGDQV
jgi:hypothetical protein